MKQKVEKGKSHLAHQDKHFQAIFDQAAVGIILVEAITGRFLRANKKYCDIVGYSEEELCNMDLQSITHPDDLKHNSEKIELLISGKIREFSIDKRYICKNGEFIWVNETISPIWSPGEKPSHHITLIQDIKSRKNDDALQKSEAKTRLILEAIPDMLFTINKSGVLVGFKAAKGIEPLMPPEVFIGKNISDVLPSMLAEENLNHIELVIKTGKAISFEYELPEKGIIHNYEAEVSPLSGDEVLSIVRDVTDRKKVENALRESEERYRKLVDFSPYGIVIHSEGKIMFMNLAGAKIFGAPDASVLIGKTVMEFIHPDHHEIARERIRIQGVGKMAPLIEEKFVRIDGTYVDVEIVSIPFTYMGKPAMYGVFRDITTRKHIEKERFESERRYGKTLEDVNMVAVTLDTDGKITFANDFLLGLTDWTRDEVMGKDWFNIFVPPEQGVKDVFISAIKKKYLPLHFINHIMTKTGELRLISWNNIMLFDIDGRITGTASIGEDITEREIKEQLLIENERLEVADKVKSEFIANVSHELRTPLIASIGFSELLEWVRLEN
ncbi:MAG: PAS domain S-box protein [Candidatus Methanoperedens sp.]